MLAYGDFDALPTVPKQAFRHHVDELLCAIGYDCIIRKNERIMNIKDYTYIVEIADQLNLTAAADRLCITQSALTKYVHRVEAEVGAPLFDRRGKRFVLTAVGRLYVEKGREIIKADRSLTDEIQKLKESGANAIRMGYGMGFADFMMDRLLPLYFSHPGMRPISVQEGSSSSLAKDVEDGNLDICLAYVNHPRPGLDYTPLKTTGPVLIVPEHSPLLLQAKDRSGFPHPVIDDDLWLREPYIRIATFTQSGAMAQRYFSHLGKWPDTRLYVEDVRSALCAVAHGLGNCILMEPPYVRYPVGRLCLSRETDLEQQVCMVTAKGVHPDASLATLQNVIKQAYDYAV